MPRRNKKEPPTLFRTGEILADSGITRQMLYYYAHLGLITEVERTPGGHRRWGEDVFSRIKLILKLNHSGYPLRDIREIFFHEKQPVRRKKKKPARKPKKRSS